MSFILDAIAKSERERQQQELPGPQVLAMPTNPPPQSRGVLPYVVVGALLLNAAVLFAWMQSEQSLLSAQAPVAVVSEAPNDVVAVEPTSAAELDTSVVPETRVVDVEPEPTTVATVSTVEPDNTAAMTRKATTDVSTSAGAQTDAQFEPASDGIPSDWIRIGPDTLSTRAETARPAQPSQRSSAQPVRVSSLSELPGDVRENLPSVVFSGHLYSSDPASSIVFVDDGRPVAQGRRIADELYLHEITPTGVVVEFRGYLIDVGVLQNWTLN